MIEFSQDFKYYAEVGLNIFLGIVGWSAIIFLLICAGACVVQVVNFYRDKYRSKSKAKI